MSGLKIAEIEINTQNHFDITDTAVLISGSAVQRITRLFKLPPISNVLESSYLHIIFKRGANLT